MNLRAEVSLMLAAHGQIPSCLFFRSEDALRLDGCVRLLLGDGQSLALTAAHEAVLDHYADLLMHRLHRAAHCPVEVCFPASTAALVSRFQELVASLSVQQAMAAQPGTPPERIWVVHDAGALAAPELQLLARLVSNFPGAGVRVVLLFGPGSAGQAAMGSLGRRFAIWDVETPNPAQAQAMLTQARQQGGEAVVVDLLSKLPSLRQVSFPSAAPAASDSLATPVLRQGSATPARPAVPPQGRGRRIATAARRLGSQAAGLVRGLVGAVVRGLRKPTRRVWPERLRAAWPQLAWPLRATRKPVTSASRG